MWIVEPFNLRELPDTLIRQWFRNNNSILIDSIFSPIYHLVGEFREDRFPTCPIQVNSLCKRRYLTDWEYQHQEDGNVWLTDKAPLRHRLCIVCRKKAKVDEICTLDKTIKRVLPINQLWCKCCRTYDRKRQKLVLHPNQDDSYSVVCTKCLKVPVNLWAAETEEALFDK